MKKIVFMMLVAGLFLVSVGYGETKPEEQLGNFPRDFGEFVSLYMPDDQLGALSSGAYFIEDYDGDGDKDIWTGELLYRNTGEYKDGVPIFEKGVEMKEKLPIVGLAKGDLNNDGIEEVVLCEKEKLEDGSRRHHVVWYAIRPPGGDMESWQSEKLGDMIEASGGGSLYAITMGTGYTTIDIFDLDGDGLDDLVCGGRTASEGMDRATLANPYSGWGYEKEFWPPKDPEGMLMAGQNISSVWWHRNLGTAKEPKFHPGRLVTVGVDDRPLVSWGYCTSAMTDWDEDGREDLLVASMTGLYMYRNLGVPVDQNIYDTHRVKFADAKRIVLGKSDEQWGMAGYLRVVDWDKDHRKSIVFVHAYGFFGKGVMRFVPNKGTGKKPYYDEIVMNVVLGGQLKVDTFAIPTVVDWNGDGLLDLIIGSEAGLVFYYRNLGRAGDVPQFATGIALKGGDTYIRPLTVSGMTDTFLGAQWGYTNPEAADWDNDGDLDLLLGWQGASMILYENTGTRKEPVLAKGVEVEEAGKKVFISARTRPVCVDWNGDGLTDLIALDIDGYLVYHERYKEGGKLGLKKPTHFKLENGEGVYVAGYYGPPNEYGYQRRKNARVKTTVIDWDEDGDLDFIIGNRGRVRLRVFENVGTQENPRFRNLGMPEYLTKYKSGHYRLTAPGDFDGDGKWEVITGGDRGDIYYCPRVAVEKEIKKEQ